MSSFTLINRGLGSFIRKGALLEMDSGAQLYSHQQKQTEGTVNPDSSRPRLYLVPVHRSGWTPLCGCRLGSAAEMIARPSCVVCLMSLERKLLRGVTRCRRPSQAQAAPCVCQRSVHCCSTLPRVSGSQSNPPGPVLPVCAGRPFPGAQLLS